MVAVDKELAKLFQKSAPAPFKTPVSLDAFKIAEEGLEQKEEEIAEDAEKKLVRKVQKESAREQEERLQRTIFVGNVPVACVKSKRLTKALQAIFAKHGRVETLRYRSVAIAKRMPKKTAIVQGLLNEKRDSINAFLVMESPEVARKCIAENGVVFEEHHLRVDLAAKPKSTTAPQAAEGEGAATSVHSDRKKSVFLGNLPLDIKDELLWRFFQTCGQISNVRVIRDRKTGLGKGFGYVAFASRSSVSLAIQLDGTDCGGRPIRVQRCKKPDN